MFVATTVTIKDTQPQHRDDANDANPDRHRLAIAARRCGWKCNGSSPLIRSVRRLVRLVGRKRLHRIWINCSRLTRVWIGIRAAAPIIGGRAIWSCSHVRCDIHTVSRDMASYSSRALSVRRAAAKNCERYDA